MTIKLIRFHPEHLEHIDYRFHEIETLEVWPGLKKAAIHLPQAGPCFSGVIDGEIVGSAGLIKLWPGVAEAWMVTGTLTNNHALSFHKCVKHGLNRLIETLGLHRVQISVYQYYDMSIKWVERLGFKSEGLMDKYGPDGSNFYRYAITRGK